MASENEAVVRRLIDEVINQGQTSPLAELVGADHVGHDTLGDHYGPDGVRISVAELRTAFPDLRISIDDLLAAGDRVVHRFTMAGTHAGPFLGLPATGRPVRTTGIEIGRISGGKLAERWSVLDTIGLLRQLGAVAVLRQRAGKQPSTHDEDSKRK
jgi:steroid delta-isomerase-like uncharacterized protein